MSISCEAKTTATSSNFLQVCVSYLVSKKKWLFIAPSKIDIGTRIYFRWGKDDGNGNELPESYKKSTGWVSYILSGHDKWVTVYG
jgi:hypothetical protein